MRSGSATVKHKGSGVIYYVADGCFSSVDNAHSQVKNNSNSKSGLVNSAVSFFFNISGRSLNTECDLTSLNSLYLLSFPLSHMSSHAHALLNPL